jgi:transposase
MSKIKEKIYSGIDVSKHHLDVACGGKTKRFTHDPKGHEELFSWLVQQAGERCPHVIFEPSGGYEVSLAEFLTSRDVAWSRPNALRVRDFARSKGIMAKTDRIDAVVLADYGEQYRPAAQQLEPDGVRKLKALMNRREQVTQLMTQEKVALESTRDSFARKEIQNSIRRFERDIKRLDEQVTKALEDEKDIKAKVTLMQSYSGVGKQTALVLAAFLPELGQVNRREIASLGGLAPVTRESGLWKGKRTLGPGRVRVRKALYMAALSASRYNEILKELYQKMRAEGKPAKVALCAIARRLLTALNTLIKTSFPQPSET